MKSVDLNYPKVASQSHYDLIIIGGGASGISAATRISKMEKEVLLVNAGLPIGGTCVNIGCVPSKILIEMANNYYYSQFPHYDSILGKCACISDADYAKSVQEKDEMVKSLRNQNYKIPLEDMENVEVISGYAQFVSNDKIEVNDSIYTADKFLISTGSTPKVPSIRGLDKIEYLTSKEALSLSNLPDSLIIIGAGPTGLELAQMFHHFGSEVTVLEAKEQVVSGTDREIADELYQALIQEEISIHLNYKIDNVIEDEGTIYVSGSVDGKVKDIGAEKLLVATGVQPNSAGLMLEKTGVTVDHEGFIKTNEWLQTDVPKIWAAGDVVGNAILETTAAKEGYLVVGNMYLNEKKSIDYNVVPRAVFTTPNLAVVGLTEEEARQEFDSVDTRVIEYTRIPKAVALKETKGKIKMVIDDSNHQVLGIHMTAHNAAEFITEASLIIKYGLTIEEIIDTVHVFPTMSEGIKKVAQAFIRDVTKMACCVE